MTDSADRLQLDTKVATAKKPDTAKADATVQPKMFPIQQPLAAGLESITRTVELAETEAAMVASNIAIAAIPNAVVAESAAKIAASLKRTNEILSTSPVDLAVLDPLIQRLGHAIGSIFVLARQHQVPMRPAHLEEMFDREDELRKAFTADGVASRAEKYYDEDLVVAQHTDRADPDAKTLAQDLKGGGGGHVSDPRNRDELVARILSFADQLHHVLLEAAGNAEGVLKEPNLPKRPEVVEKLIEAALGIVLAVGLGGVARVVGGALKSLASSTGAEEHLGGVVTEVLVDGLKDAAKENAKMVVALAGQPSPAGENAMLSPKTKFLRAVRAHTSDAMGQVSENFAAQKGTLMRVPVSTLQGVRRACNDQLLKSVKASYESTIIHEWINFGREATMAGEDVRDAEKKTGSKLDASLTSYGVLRVRVKLENGELKLMSADIPGVGDGVFGFIQSEHDLNLATVPIHRRVELEPPNEMTLPPGGFDIDPNGNIAAVPTAIDEGGRRVWASLGKHRLADEVGDGDVYIGMYALLRWLHSVPCSKIEKGEA